MHSSVAFALVGAGLLWIAATGPACAYIDPGTGSYFLQILAAGVFAALFTMKAFWRTIRESSARFFSKRRKQ